MPSFKAARGWCGSVVGAQFGWFSVMPQLRCVRAGWSVFGAVVIAGDSSVNSSRRGFFGLSH